MSSSSKPDVGERNQRKKGNFKPSGSKILSCFWLKPIKLLTKQKQKKRLIEKVELHSERKREERRKKKKGKKTFEKK